jgi:tryptophan halogenase
MTEATPDKIRRVVVVGGGTAGWIAATTLAKHLSPMIEVVLVESDEIGTVGVGESTIPTVRSFHSFIGIDEDAFVRATNASFKLGIGFEDWDRPGDRYFHSFGSVGRSVFVADFQHFWLEAQHRGFGRPYGDYSLELRAAAENRFSTDPELGLAYAYHLDATAYARFLRGLAEADGVKRIEGRIAEVSQDAESGDIRSLVLASGERVDGDFFIDCTGFRALLIEQTLKAGFDDWSQWLACDSAFAVQTESAGEPVPYTRAIAHDAGWRWRIPLQHRVGNGFVFCSQDMDNDTARETLLGALDSEPLFEPRLLRFTAGMRRRSWHRNCLALGLAGGFIEPLESTSIHLVMIAITRFIQSFPFTRDYAALAERFNTRSEAEWTHVRDFVILHYALNHRAEPFWQRMAQMTLPDTLAARLDLFREQAMAHQDQDEIFRVDSWCQVMMGQGLTPDAWHLLPSQLPDANLRQALDGLDAGINARLPQLPTLARFLERYGAPIAAVAQR